MNTTLPADWPDNVADARLLQSRTRDRVIRDGPQLEPRLVAGVDVHVGGDDLAWAAAALLEWPSLELVASALASRPARFPYVPGYLSFREIPAVLAALALLDETPDLIMVDGQGIAHPRRLGIAAHLGVVTDMPTIGVAKSRLFGRHEPPPARRGSWTPLMAGRERIGAVLCTKDGVRPLFISIGHRISLEQSIALVMAGVTRYRLPEPTRLADKLSRCHPG